MAAPSLDADAYQQLSLMGQQYVNVEKEMRNLAEELRTNRKRRRQLAAQVKFLRRKLRSFRRVPELDGPSQAARDLKSMEEPQFFEVEVKFSDSLNSGMMDSMVFEYPPRSSDPQDEFAPNMFSIQRKFLAR